MKETEQTLLDIPQIISVLSIPSVGPEEFAQKCKWLLEQMDLYATAKAKASCESESAYKEVESSEPQDKPRRQEFEKYPVLTEHISRMYHTGYIGSLIEWSNFLQELNSVLKVSAPSESQEELSYDKIRSEYLNHRGRIWTKEEVMLKWIIENYKLITRNP